MNVVSASRYKIFSALIGLISVPALALPVNPTLEYTDASGVKQTKEDIIGVFILEENATDLIFNSGSKYLYDKTLYLNAGTFSNLELVATGNEAETRVSNIAEIGGNISVSGKTGYFYNNGGTILSGTKFNLNAGTVEFGTSRTHTWNIAESDTTSPLITGTGAVMLRNTTINWQPYTSWLRLNFDNEDLLKKTATLQFAASTGITTTSLNFEGIEITVDGWEAIGYSATLDWDSTSPNFGKITIIHPYIPEPSAFGLFAGLGALALVVSRRRHFPKT